MYFFTNNGLLILLLLTGIVYKSNAQVSDSIIPISNSIAKNYTSQIANKIDLIDKKLSRQTIKALQEFERQEAKLKKKLVQKDSTAKELFAFTNKKMHQLQADFMNMPDKMITKINEEYNAYLDTLQSTFKFLQKNAIS